MQGYDALRERVAFVDVSDRGKIRVTGEDRARLLHAMTTNDVKAMTPGQHCYAFFLNAQGRILADVNVICREDDFLLDTEPGTRAKLYEHLDKFIIADDVTLADVTATMATFAVEGPRAAAIVAGCGWTAVPRGAGFLLMGPAGAKPACLDGVEQADGEALNVVRLERGQPRYGDDIGERFLVQETGQMHAVSFQKGCYLGQEIVERVRSRAQIHRRLLPLRIEGSAIPAPGTKLQAGGKEAVELTSAAYSPALGQVVALGYVRIDVKAGDAVSNGEFTGVVA